MRRLVLVKLLIVTLILLATPGAVFGQTTRTANPRRVVIKISQAEPLPAGIQTLVFFPERGGGGPEQEINPSNPYWKKIPNGNDVVGEYRYFMACGYRNPPAPSIVLTSPGGNETRLSTENYADCYTASTTFQMGMELGTYQIVAVHPEGQIAYQFQTEYASVPSAFNVSDSQYVLMGFMPNALLTLNFYHAFFGTDTPMTNFLAQRTIEADQDGALFVEISPTPSLGLTAQEIGFTVGGFESTLLESGMGGPELSLASGGRANSDVQCANAPATRLLDKGAARVLPGPANNLRVAPGGEIIGKIRSGETMEVIGGENSPAYGLLGVVCYSDGLIYYLVSYNGQIGWTAEGKGNQYFLEPS